MDVVLVPLLEPVTPEDGWGAPVLAAEDGGGLGVLVLVLLVPVGAPGVPLSVGLLVAVCCVPCLLVFCTVCGFLLRLAIERYAHLPP